MRVPIYICILESGDYRNSHLAFMSGQLKNAGITASSVE